MLVLYLFNKFLGHKTDPAFATFWEQKFLPRIRYYLVGAFFYYVFIVGVLVELLLWGNDSFLFGALVFAMVMLVYGSFLVRYIIAFFGANNRRYIMIRSGFQQDEFDKSNVIN